MMRPPRWVRAAARPATLAAVLLIGLAAGPFQGAGAQPQEGWMVHVWKDGDVLRFAPDRVEVYPGTVVVLGHIAAPHSMVAVDGTFNATGNASDWPHFLAPGPGTYPFYCWLHAEPGTRPDGGMAALLVVTARGEAPPAGGPRDAAAGPDPDVPRPATPAAAARPVPAHGLLVLVAAGALLAATAHRRR